MELMDVIQDNMRTRFLIAGIGNAFSFLVGTIFVILGGVATCGVGCLLFFLPLINLTVMIFDFLAMQKAIQPPSPSTYSFLKMASIFDLFAFFALAPLIVGILNLQTLGRADVYTHFHGQAQA